ncbi:MAG: DUF86 domain-containing protein [Dictyoglomaceae bacterium]|nr:DUF86 domain-containing protein [Dictyoglomaceae bacterium]
MGEKIDILKEYFERIPEVAFSFLFGSRSKGYGRESSDYDIGIYFYPENPKIIEFEEGKDYPLVNIIWRDLELMLKKEVDLIVLNNSSVSLSANIITKGIPIVIKDRKLFLNFLLVVSSWAEEMRNFVKEYYEIFERSKSLSEQDKESLLRILLFLENEMEDFEWAKTITFIEYEKDKHKRRDLERWVENIMNSVIDIAKILLASNRIDIPETYRNTIIKLKVLEIFKEEDVDKISEWIKLRNILAHQYLYIKWEKINSFIREGEEIIYKFIEKVKKLIEES